MEELTKLQENGCFWMELMKKNFFFNCHQQLQRKDETYGDDV